MKNELTTAEWLALAEALDYVNEVYFYELRGDMVPDYENVVEKVKNTAEKINERNI
ncbi:hypothetical protein [Enterococcus sp. HY326]|uniref:hypothetical protein n=1 Tax=Enterococcus sp. HY326 TaxID=2971265 RepID=UPI002240A3E4|nr:hypothetical protein [Enterococcus sp. HY326]